MTRVAIVIVSHNSAEWLSGCLSSILAHAGGAEVELIVVDAASTDATRDVVSAFPSVRLVPCENRGFAYANNRGTDEASSPWILFLNPDTEVVEGSIAELVETAERFPGAAIFGVRQVGGDRRIEPSMRRFPHPVRWLCEALGSERWPVRGAWTGERVLESGRYEHVGACDWTSGSAMLVRAEPLQVLRGMDEAFFLYCEEPDLSLRALRGGWRTMHLPVLTVVHYGGNESTSPRLAAQLAYAHRQYMAKHFSGTARVLGTAALGLGYALRSIAGSRKEAARAALRAVLGLSRAPYPLDRAP